MLCYKNIQNKFRIKIPHRLTLLSANLNQYSTIFLQKTEEFAKTHISSWNKEVNENVINAQMGEKPSSPVNTAFYHNSPGE